MNMVFSLTPCHWRRACFDARRQCCLALVVTSSIGVLAASIHAQPTAGPSKTAPTAPQPPATRAADTLTRLSAASVDTSLLVGIASRAEVAAWSPLIATALADADAALATLPAVAPPDDPERARVTLLRARAAILAFAVGQASDQPLRERTRPLADLRFETTAAEGLRRLTLAVSPPEGEDARDLIQSVLDFPVGDDPLAALPIALHVEALGHRVRLAKAISRPATSEAINALHDAIHRPGKGRPELRWLLLEAEIRAGSMLDPTLKGPALIASVEPLAALWREAARDPTREAATAAIEAKLARAISMGMPGAAAASDFPRDLALVWAKDALVATSADSPARGVLARLADGSEPEAPIALAALAAANLASATSPVTIWINLTTRFPNSPAARAAVDSAASLIDQVFAGTPPAWLTRSDDETAVLDLLIRARREDHRQPVWRLQLARAVKATQPARALELLAGSHREPPLPVPLAAEAAELGMVLALSMRNAVYAGGGGGGTPSIADLRAACAWAVAVGASTRDSLTVALADTLAKDPVAAHRDEARRLYESVLAPRPAGQKPLVPELAHGARLGLALLTAQRDRPAAFAALTALAEELDRVKPEANQGPRVPEFWRVWSEMLTLMSADNAEGQRTAQIRLRIRQLRTIDDRLGAGAAAERITAIERNLK